MKIAVIGSGIAGLAATWYLGKHHQVTLCERGPGIGMDAQSIELDTARGPVYINAPMRVFFEGYYPDLTQLYQELGAEFEPIQYSGCFSRLGERAYFQYRNHWLGDATLPWLTGRSAWTPAAWRLGLALIRFGRHIRGIDLASLPDTLTIERFLDANGYTHLGQQFLYPTFAGICTCSYNQVKAYPAAIILDYLSRDLVWSRVNRLTHGVRDIVERLVRGATDVRYNVDLKSICPGDGWVRVSDGHRYQEQFDHVVIATQADQARCLLPASMDAEREALAQIRYQTSRLVVHRDPRLAPAERRDWAPVNFVISRRHDMPMASIWMNRIYPELRDGPPLFETWNPFAGDDIEHTLIDTVVDRPVVTADSLVALQALKERQQRSDSRISLCGSYAERGIPLLESAVSSARSIAERLVP